MMNEERRDVPEDNESLVKCDKINQIMHSIYYNVCQLKRLNQQFEQNADLNQAQESFLALHALLDIRENETEYLNQYQSLLINALSHLSDFIFKLDHPETLVLKQRIRLASITEELTRYQKEILSVNW